jgi:Ca-activated chloride channel homolog
MESGSSAGTVLSEKKAKELPLVSSNGVDAVKATGGVAGVAPGESGAWGGGVAGGVAKAEMPASASAAASHSAMRNNLAAVAQNDGMTANDARYGRPWPMPMPPRHKGMPPPWQKPGGDFNTEAYDNILDNPFLDAAQNPLSTFSIDVDTASYSNVRRFLDGGSLPPKDAVRIEELVNYFDYDYKGPRNDKPFAANFEITEAPWKPEHRLLRIGLKGREMDPGKRPDSNLVFLLDVSGSMADENKLPLVKESMSLLVDQLTESDRVAIVVYASDTNVFLKCTSGDQKEKLRHAIERLHAGGSTNGASGIQLAYQTAKDNFIKGGINRVILATDGDFNVGMTNRGDLTRLIEERANSGIFLSALGFGMGNYKDATLELLANKGRGNYAYIDTPNEAKKVLVEQINSTLVSIAKDVKIQVEFNPRRVSSYRLIGYEDRIIAKEDFNDDTKKAGVIGAGHAVTALYEIVPAGISEAGPGVDRLKYQKPPASSAAGSDELLTVKIRSKEPEKETSVLSEFAVKESKEKFSDASRDFKFAAAVAAFGMALRDSPYQGSANLESALEWAKAGMGADKHGYRQEFIRLVHRAISISD